MKWIEINHDGMARTSVYRALVPKEDRRECQVCSRPGRFRYAIPGDDNNRPIPEPKRAFCSIWCWREWHG